MAVADITNEIAWEAGGLTRAYVVPPFSVLDTRSGYWRERQAAWAAQGIESGEGREVDVLSTSTPVDDIDTASFGYSHVAPRRSEFDPVLAELAVRWFSHEGWSVLDPFAGGSVRGIVTEKVGRRYLGIDLRAEQVAANEEQAIRCGVAPRWRVGDSRYLNEHATDERFDLLFSCPPYFDLERYSDDPADLSNADDYDAFIADYSHIIGRAASLLRPDRFAVWVVGDVRDERTGMLRGLVGDTVAAFRRAGLRLYNDAVLLNQAGTAAMRAPRQFGASRKLVRVHQYVLVFAKGRPRPSDWTLGDIAAIEPQGVLFGDLA